MPVLMMLDTTQAAKRCGYCRQSIVWWIRVGVRVDGRRVRLRASRAGEGGHWRIAAADLAEFVATAVQRANETPETLRTLKAT